MALWGATTLGKRQSAVQAAPLSLLHAVPPTPQRHPLHSSKAASLHLQLTPSSKAASLHLQLTPSSKAASLSMQLTPRLPRCTRS